MLSKLVVIDHLNEFELTWDKDRNDLKIEEVMYKLKDIWRRYNIAIILIAILMLVFVVPTLTKIFKDFGTELPTSTKFIIFVQINKYYYIWAVNILISKNETVID